MTDIVEKLRSTWAHSHNTLVNPNGTEAADEIELLRKVLKRTPGIARLSFGEVFRARNPRSSAGAEYAEGYADCSDAIMMALEQVVFEAFNKKLEKNDD